MGYKKINAIQQFDFQINRVLTYGDIAGNYEDIKKATDAIGDITEWFDAWLRLGEKAEKNKEYMHSAYAYRMAEFFLKESHSRKYEMYEKAIQNFYFAFDNMNISYKCHEIPYQNSSLHTIFLKAKEEKDVILVCGGYDSFIEEFVIAVIDILKHGHSIIMYEGDGQGKTLQNGLPLIYDWERPTSCVLDYFHIKQCALIGISWGGYLALRAAAFDKRIQSVVAYDAMDNGYEVMTAVFPYVLRKMIRYGFSHEKEKMVNRFVSFAMKKSVLADWAISQGKYISGTDTPYTFYEKLKKHLLDEKVLNKLTQNVLLLAGEKDHYIPHNQYYRLKKNIHNAKSLKCRMFTAEEGGEQHCQIGNHGLAVNEILEWLRNLA